ncbi:hypothetical protein CSB08_00135 [Candidatus Gracilibacteria bacterium]|nr:MAG: hypothetical protein CSB08_00135 [Candidatus Gracilibacteria bacterium]PIE85684.1 MAG: hypothetical protein CSA08_00605 [Candidatus Gracilibacteria bacterium]
MRITEKGNNINYKIPLSHNFGIANQEFETSIGNVEVIRNILLSIGFSEYGYSKKYRDSYIIGNIKFDLDKYDNMPDFIEIESNNNIDIEKGVILLGYTMKDVVKLTERGLKEYYNLI